MKVDEFPEKKCRPLVMLDIVSIGGICDKYQILMSWPH